MFQTRKLIPRLVLLGAITAYLAADLFVFRGLLHRTIEGYKAPKPQIAARVSGHPITQSQLDRALTERLWLEGKSVSDLNSAELKSTRDAALDELIDHELLRLQVKSASPEIQVSDEEVHESIRRLLGRFESKGELETAMISQGIADEESLRDRLTERIRQEKFIARRIGPSIAVTEVEARKWYDENESSISLPERIEARQVFISTLNRAPDEAKQKLDTALLDLTAKKMDFPSLARELSDDSATKESGGSLGWMTRDRLPADFAAPVFSLEIGRPTLVRTKLGWHLVEVTARQPAEPRTFEQAKPEILAALEAIKRRKAIEEFRKSLRKSEAAEIELLSETRAR